MASRTVAVALKAEIGSYVASMNKAAAATMTVGEAATKTQSSSSKAFDMAGKGAIIMGGAIVAGLGVAVGKSMEFEKSLSAISAATGASGAKLEQFRDAAMKAGADTAFSATEAADAITEMAKAGVSSADIMGGGLTGALSLAAAGQIDVAEAAGIASTAMTQFSLSGKDLPHVADLLAAGAGKAMGSVDDLGMALGQAGLVASSAGMSIEETTGTLAAFASAGLIGSDSGTSLKSMLLALEGPSAKAAQTMSDLGINVYDNQGKMLDMAGIAGQLQTHLSGLTEEQRNSALATIFGSDAVRAANVLYKEGASGINDWTGKVSDAGYASKQAAALQDNLAGDLEKLGGSFDTLMISIGHGLQGPGRDLVQFLGSVVDGATGLIKIFGDLPGPVQAGLAGFALWAVAGSKVGDVFGAIRGKVQGFREELQLQQSLLAMQQSSAAGAAAGYGTLADRIDATTGVARGLGSEMEGTGKKFGVARAAVGGFARAIGPELGVAAAIALVGDLASKINAVATAGAGAADQIRALNGTIKDADSNSARFEATNAGLDDMRSKLRDAQQVVDHFEGQNPFDQWVWRNPFGSEMEDAKDAKEAIAHYNEEIDRLEAGHRRAESSTQALADKLHLSKGEVVELADKYGIDLTGKVDTTRIAFETMYAREYGTTPIDAANATGAAMASAKAQTEEAAKAQEDWISNLQDIATSFTDPLAAYTGLLDVKTQAERDQAQATADATASSKDSWKDYVGDVSVSLDEYAQKLQDQLTAQANWRTNIVLITQAGGLEVGQQLAAMGVQGTGLVQQMVDAIGTDQFPRLVALMKEQARLGGSGAASELDTQMKVMAAIGAAGAGATAAGIAQQLGVGVQQVAAIAAQYGITLASGVNPVITALGRSPITIDKVIARNERYIGGYVGDGGKYEPKGIVHGGEFVLTKEQTAKAGVGNLYNYARSLDGYANGGYVTSADVPKPYSTAPYGAPISTAGDASMGKEYDEVTAFLKAQEAISAGPAAGAGVQRWLPVVLQSLAMIGQPASLAQTVLRRMNQESGGNPTIVNRTDSNWARGTPSVGLMQVIGPTYRAYKDGRRDVGPYSYGTSVDPLANILASEHYALSRYGSLSAAYNKAGGYAAGGYTGPGGKNEPAGIVHKGEFVVPADAVKRIGVGALGAMVGLPGYADGGFVRWGSVSESEWRRLLASGWKGRAGDSMEALYPPATSPAQSREFASGAGTGTVVKVAAPSLTGLTIRGRVTIDGDGIATIAGRVVDSAMADLADGVHYGKG